MITLKKKTTWTKTYELLMKKHLELCVELKDHYTAKDGLHQYRNLCINVSPPHDDCDHDKNHSSPIPSHIHLSNVYLYLYVIDRVIQIL